MEKLTEAIQRMDRNVDDILQDIETGKDPSEAIKRYSEAMPYHVIAMGNAFVADTLKRHAELIQNDGKARD